MKMKISAKVMSILEAKLAREGEALKKRETATRLLFKTKTWK